MAPRFTARELVIASHNPGKVREIADLVRPFDVAVISAGELGLPEPEETGTTFAANARLKAEAAAAGADRPALADDSGLAVPALDGAPGIYSARWAGPDKDFMAAMQRIEDELAALSGDAAENHRAHFVCALALSIPGGETQIFEGEAHGTLVWPPRGDKGFGYDPMFVPDGHDETFGEMDQSLKHSISHRANAFRMLIDAEFRDDEFKNA